MQFYLHQLVRNPTVFSLRGLWMVAAVVWPLWPTLCLCLWCVCFSRPWSFHTPSFPVKISPVTCSMIPFGKLLDNLKGVASKCLSPLLVLSDWSLGQQEVNQGSQSGVWQGSTQGGQGRQGAYQRLIHILHLWPPLIWSKQSRTAGQERPLSYG